MSASGSRLSHRKQQIWVCVIAGLFLCDFVLCSYLPLQQRMTSLREARAQQRRTIDMAAGQSVELARLKSRLRETEKLVECFDASVPSDRALGAFLQHMEAVMSETGLTDQVVLPGKEFETADLGCIPVRITCTGTLSQMFGMFDRLQAQDRLVRIEKVAIENDAGYAGRLSMQAEVIIFYQSARLRTENTARARSVEEVNRDA